MNFESEFQYIMIENLKEQYSLEDEAVLFHYFLLRLYISRMGKPMKKNEETELIIRFLCEELNLPEGDFFYYRGEFVKKNFSLENSLVNIVESWKFENSIRTVVDDKGMQFSRDDHIQRLQHQIHRYATNKSKSFKGTQEYDWYWKYQALCHLNSIYNANPKNPVIFDGVSYPPTHNHFKRTLEEICEAWIHATTQERNDTKTVTEAEVERHLYPRLETIEAGLIYVDRQVVISDGRIDILAKDRRGTFVIIELKVVEDKELVWQCLYYPMQIMEKFNVTKVRMITLAPKYSKSLQLTLGQLKHVEMKLFVPKVRRGKIESLYICDFDTNAA
ncbi:endonuclease NucS (plasmid) [Paenibacillus thiaminolyticus]|uniref:endonuclease NucS domain-containing protein n=1 Tax=Paenibacillus thiaminolyticus TaxID=49283 RepID=UPI00232C321D|nr:endonuclease NucS domain-containing protein [Paenibacillus thiaminolyticus]WCF11438.1 endonuclease NucS [Paenibacillus thiaminolyticus]